MARDNITNHSMRLNLNNEQHLRVHNVLKDLNTSIHKSINQFLVEAVDFYVKSFEDDEVTNEAVRHKQNGQEIITRSDLLEIKRELHDEMKDELIRVFGAAIIGGKTISFPMKRQDDLELSTEDDSIMADLAAKWG